MLLRYLLLFYFTLIIGCATANGPAFKRVEHAPENNAVVYIYRKDMGHWQSAYSPTLIVDNVEVASMPREGVLELTISSGQHTFGYRHNFMAGYKPVNLDLEILSGKIYYLKISDPISFGSEYSLHDVVYRSEIAVIEEQSALNELATTKFVTPNQTYKSN